MAKLSKKDRAEIVGQASAAGARGDTVTANNLLQKLVDNAPKPKVKK